MCSSASLSVNGSAAGPSPGSGGCAPSGRLLVMSLAPSVSRSPVSPKNLLAGTDIPRWLTVRRRVDAPWGVKVSELERDVDVVVVGMGPGGEHVADTLAEAGLAVAGVESRLVGGECPYWGCVPSKMMIRAGNLLAEGRRIPGMAGESVITPHWAPVAARIRAEATDNWDDQVAA